MESPYIGMIFRRAQFREIFVSIFFFSLMKEIFPENSSERKCVGITNAPKIVFSFRKITLTKVKAVFSKKLKYFQQKHCQQHW